MPITSRHRLIKPCSQHFRERLGSREASFGYEYFNLDSKDYSIRGKTAENIMSQIYRAISGQSTGSPTSLTSTVVGSTAANASGTSGPTNEVRLSVGASSLTLTSNRAFGVNNAVLTMDEPSHVIATASGSGVVLTWMPPVNVIPLRYAIRGTGSPGSASLPVAVTPDASTRYTIPSLPSGTYTFSVYGVLGKELTLESDQVSVRVSGSNTATAPPSGAVATVDGRDVTVTWTHPTGLIPALYAVEFGGAAGSAELGSVATGDSALTLRMPPGTYYFRVRSLNGAAVSAPSNEVSIPVAPQACNGVPGTPVLLPTSSVEGTLTISWLGAEGAAAERYRVNVTGPFGAVARLSRGAGTSLLWDGLKPGTYAVGVMALNVCGESAESSQVIISQPDVDARLGGQ